jgi:hypothetical protein
MEKRSEDSASSGSPASTIVSAAAGIVAQPPQDRSTGGFVWGGVSWVVVAWGMEGAGGFMRGRGDFGGRFRIGIWISRRLSLRGRREEGGADKGWRLGAVRRKNGAKFRLILPGVLGKEWRVRAARGTACRWTWACSSSVVMRSSGL